MQSPWFLKLKGELNLCHPPFLQSALLVGSGVNARSPTPPTLVRPTNVCVPVGDRVQIRPASPPEAKMTPSVGRTARPPTCSCVNGSLVVSTAAVRGSNVFRYPATNPA